ncbi:MAG: hypothetical protein HYX33_03765 [Actinobacteria bacterium]|nr:hypothetical protein [Actinomycetota bacterium]
MSGLWHVDVCVVFPGGFAERLDERLAESLSRRARLARGIEVSPGPGLVASLLIPAQSHDAADNAALAAIRSALSDLLVPTSACQPEIHAIVPIGASRR